MAKMAKTLPVAAPEVDAVMGKNNTARPVAFLAICWIFGDVKGEIEAAVEVQ